MAAMPYPYHTSLIVFLSVATLVGLAGLTVMHMSRNVAFTRRHLLWYVSFEGILLLVVGAALELPAVLLVIMVPLMMLFTYVQFGRYQFCETCRRTVPRLRPLSEPEFCFRCGGSLRQ
jgi:hypothetical protein